MDHAVAQCVVNQTNHISMLPPQPPLYLNLTCLIFSWNSHGADPIKKVASTTTRWRSVLSCLRSQDIYPFTTTQFQQHVVFPDSVLEEGGIFTIHIKAINRAGIEVVSVMIASYTIYRVSCNEPTIYACKQNIFV